MTEANQEAKRKDQEFGKLSIELTKRFIEQSQMLDSASDLIEAWRSLSVGQEGIIRDLELDLAVISGNPEAAANLVDSITRRHSSEMSIAKEYVNKALQASKQALQEVQQRIGRDQLKVTSARTD